MNPYQVALAVVTIILPCLMAVVYGVVSWCPVDIAVPVLFIGGSTIVMVMDTVVGEASV